MGLLNGNSVNHLVSFVLRAQILNEDPTYPEALIGRGTAYAFQRELDAAIADFTRVLKTAKLMCMRAAKSVLQWFFFFLV